MAILYTTCDDFDPYACASCLKQTHPRTRLIICDDSQNPDYQRIIDAWVCQCGQPVSVVRRPERRGFKAGNLNFAISHAVHEELIMLCDADEVLPPDFIVRTLPYFSGERVGFVQAAHSARANSCSLFASLLGPSVDILYSYFLPSRNRYGFVPLFGHGAMIRKSVWRKVGGFPEIVAEDIGFAARALVVGWRGIYAREVVAEEEFPTTYAAFVSKYCKDVMGTVQFFQTEYLPFLRSSRVSMIEKFDAFMILSTSYLGLITIINMLGSIFLSYILKLQGYAHLEFWLLLLYLIGPLTPVLALVTKFFINPLKYTFYYFFSAFAFVSIIPRLAFTAVNQTLSFSKPFFNATGKIARQKQNVSDYIDVQVLGLAFFVIAVRLEIAISIPLAGLALIFFLGPFLCYSEKNGITGFMVVCSSFAPFVMMAYLWLLI